MIKITIKKFSENLSNSSSNIFSSIKSCLFIPGNQEKMLSKSHSINANILVPDLEDSVPPLQKSNARDIILSFMKKNQLDKKLNEKFIFPRLNSLESGLFKEDLNSMMTKETQKYFQGFVIPKVNSPEEYTEINEQFTKYENKLKFPENSVKLIIWIESTKALVNIKEIFKLNKNRRIVAAAFGAEDFCNDFGIERSQSLEIPRFLFAITAHAYNILPLDTPNVEYKNQKNLIDEIEMVKKLGFKGKFAIHPNQVDIINKYFSPSNKEVNEALKIVEEYEKSEKLGRASLSVDGKMVDIPVYKRALNTLKRAEYEKKL